jgi:hypothetical protein
MAAVIGVGIMLAARRDLYGYVVCVVWLAAVAWWVGFAFAYDVTLMTDGDIHFRSLWRTRIVNAAAVKNVRRIRMGKRGNRIFLLVLQYECGRVALARAMPNSSAVSPA